MTLLPNPRTVARLALSPWVFLGKNTGVGCHFLLQGNPSNPGIKPKFPALAGGFLTAEPLGKPYHLKSFCLQASEYWKGTRHVICPCHGCQPPFFHWKAVEERHQAGISCFRTLGSRTHGQRAGKGRGAGTSLSRVVSTVDQASNALNFQEPMLWSLAPSFIWVSPNSF